MIGAYLLGVDGKPYSEALLIDSGADRTTITPETLLKLGAETFTPQEHPGFIGIGGSPGYQMFRSTLFLTAINGGKFEFPGEFVAFTDPDSSVIGILGRDILDQFDVILSRRNNQILLINETDHYTFSSI